MALRSFQLAKRKDARMRWITQNARAHGPGRLDGVGQAASSLYQSHCRPKARQKP